MSNSIALAHFSMEEDCAGLRQLAGQVAKLGQQQDTQTLSSKGLLLLLQLKESSRKQAFATEEQREETNNFKMQLEHKHLQLQNLLYEKEYYEKEIRECQSFRTKFSDERVSLIPVQDFLDQASDDVKTEVAGKPHTLMLKRLAHELQQRKEGVVRLDRVKGTKDAATKEFDKKKKVLDDLQRQLQTLEDTAKPLQTILAPHLSLKGMSRSADLLPLPIYIIYSQLAASREALGLPIKVSILGSISDAQEFAKSVGIGTGSEASTSAAAAEGEQPAAKRLKPAMTPPLLDKDDPYKVHPLSVLLEVQRESNGRLSTLMSVKFQYLLNLRVTTAHSDVPADNALLPGLYPADDGTGSDFEILAQLDGGAFKFDSTRAAKPYRWCQDLGGLDFAPPLPLATQLLPADRVAVMEGLDTYRKQQRVVQLIERLRAAKAGEAGVR